MKDFLSYSLKLFLTFIAASVISFISMMLFISAEIEFIYKILLGAMFIVFTLILTWNCSFKRGTDDCKFGRNYNSKGFLAGICAMLPAIVLEIVFIVVAFGAWKKNNISLYASLYYVLYFVFMCYLPMLSSFVPYNPVLGVDFAQPAIAFLDGIKMPNAISAPMFLIPIAVFVIVSGIAYIFGCKEQYKIKESIRNITKK